MRNFSVRRIGLLGFAIGVVLGALIIAARAFAQTASPPDLGAGLTAVATALGAAAGVGLALWARWRAARTAARVADVDAGQAEIRSALEMVRLMRGELGETMTALAHARSEVRAGDQRSDRQDEEITRLRATVEALRAAAISGDPYDADTLDVVVEPFRSSLSPPGTRVIHSKK